MSKARITVLEGDMLGKVFKLTEGIQTIGRGDGVADVVIAHQSISKIHATLEIRDDILYIIDKDSTNGVFHNREKVRQATVLDKQFFSIGDIPFRFESGAELADIVKDFEMKVSSVLDELSRKIVGREDILKQILGCFFTGSHCILTGVSDLGKSRIVKCLSEVFGLDLKRVQFTSDLVPSDIIGRRGPNEDGKQVFIEGPLFSKLLLASQLNQAAPQTQTTILEAMRENQVTAEGRIIKLPRPFMVVATQSSVHDRGEPALTESLCEHLMFDILFDHPSLKEEEENLRRISLNQNLALKKIISHKEVILFKNAIQQIEISTYIISYVTRLVRATRMTGEGSNPEISQLLSRSAGPLAGEDLMQGAKAIAAMEGRLHVNCEDIRQILFPVLRHRILPGAKALAQNLSADDIIKKILSIVKEPEMPKFV